MKTGFRVMDRRMVSVVVGLVVAYVICVNFFSGYYQYLAILTALSAIGAVALNLLMGYAGQVSIGNAAFMAVGAFTAVLFNHWGGMPVAVLVGGVAAGIAGLLVGIPSLRLRGFYLVLSTLAFQFIVQFVFQEVEQGANQPAGFMLPLPTFGSYTLQSNAAWLTLSFAVLGAAMIATQFLVRGRLGRAWAAVREHEIAAGVSGVNVTRYKLLAFVMSSFIIGVQGALLAFYVGNVDYNSYGLDVAISYAAMVLIGGLGLFYGPLLGALVVNVVPAILLQLGSIGSGNGWISSNSTAIGLFIYGALIVVVVIVEPGGMADLIRRGALRLARPFARRRAVAPTGGADVD